MKRREFVRHLTQQGCVLVRHGANHDIFLNPETGLKQPVPRHAELDNTLVKHILRHLALERKT